MGGSQVDDRGHGFQAEEGSGGGRSVSSALPPPSVPASPSHAHTGFRGLLEMDRHLMGLEPSELAAAGGASHSSVGSWEGPSFPRQPGPGGLEGLGSSTPPGASSLPLPLHFPAWFEFSGLSDSGRPDALEDLGHKQVNINHRIYSQGKPVWAGCLEERQVLSLPPS